MRVIWIGIRSEERTNHTTGWRILQERGTRQSNITRWLVDPTAVDRAVGCPGSRCLTYYDHGSVHQLKTSLARDFTSERINRAGASIRWIQAVLVVCCSTRTVFGGRSTARTCSTPRANERVTHMTRAFTIRANVIAATVHPAATVGFRERGAAFSIADFWLSYCSSPFPGSNATFCAAATPPSPRYYTILT